MAEAEQSGTPINVAVFIDYENVHKALLAQRTNILRLSFFEKLRKWCSNNQRRVVRIVVYCNFDNADLHDSYHQSILQNYGVETVHTSNQGKNYADLKITIDVLTSMYSNNNIDEFFIMSNDKDMTPLLNTIRANKRNVVVITTGENYNPTICEFADKHITLESICSEEVDHKIIDTIANSYWKKFEAYIAKKIADYSVTKNYSHYGLNYAFSNEIKFSKVMNYELATIIKEFYDKKQMFFYNYSYKSNSYVGFAPSDKQQDLLSLGIIQPTDIIATYDIQADIERLYSDAQK
nr:NYN domain-containing protein [uncultured Oscillibacter sp.]